MELDIEDIKQLVIVRGDVQIFDDIEYRRSTKWPYFERFGKRLHRAVWEWHNGPIKTKFQVHHLDENRENNQIENLELLPILGLEDDCSLSHARPS